MNSKYEQISKKIADHVRLTLEYCNGISHDEFMNNRMLQDACVFNVLQVGELAARVIEYGLDQERPEIMWRQMRGMRNKIAHDYEGIRLEIVWDTIQDDFPMLLQLLK